MRRQITAGALAALLGFSTIGCDEQDYDDPAAPVIDDTQIEPGDSYQVEDDPTNTIYPNQPLDMDDEPTAEPTPSGDDTPETPPRPTPPTGSDTGTEPDDAVSEVPASELPDDDGN